jgi:hypothetical protein
MLVGLLTLKPLHLCLSCQFLIKGKNLQFFMFIVMHMILKLLLLCLLAIVCVMNLMEHDGLGFGSVIKEKK